MSDRKEGDILNRLLELIKQESGWDFATVLSEEIGGYCITITHRVHGELYRSTPCDLDTLCVEYLDTMQRLKRVYA